MAAIGTSPCDAKTKSAARKNWANEQLVKLSPDARAARLATKVGNWCIGTKAFLMGIATSGPRAGAAYWSLQCLDGHSYAIELDVDGIGTVIDCQSFAQSGFGKKCFQKF